MEKFVKIRSRRLPHWEIQGGTYFVTFNLNDAIPQRRAEELRERRTLLKQLLATAKGSRITELQLELKRLAWIADRDLDCARGECLLRIPRVASLVRDTLHHFNGERYRLMNDSIMPNHVHVVFQLLEEWTLASLLHSWKTWTAREANKLLGRSGTFWESEYYDVGVHDQHQTDRAIDYVLNNPVRAGLEDWPWVEVLDRQWLP